MKYGYFDDENREYVITKPDVPASWTNYLGVKDMCTVLSHNAGGYSFYKSAEHGRITRFRANAVPLDRPGHYVYIRDDKTGEFWTISWQPVGLDLNKARYECRHGLSYSTFKCSYNDIEAEKTLFIPLNDNVELWDVKIKNTGSREKELSLFSYLEFSFHHIEVDNQNLQMSLYAGGTDYKEGIIEYDFFYEPWTYHYHTANFEPDGFDSMRDAFIGTYNSESNPEAVIKGKCSSSKELGGNHCGALHKKLVLKPGEEKRFVFMLGVGDSQAAKKIRTKYTDPSAVDTARAELKEYWDKKVKRYQCKTPHQGLNTMINTWTLYQAETCVVWSRFASFVEVGGRTGLGYRDTSQDLMSVIHTNPAKCRQRIIELLRGQTSMGYGLHLFDPDFFDPAQKNKPKFVSPTVKPEPSLEDVIHGLDEVCADDALWLVVSVCEYIKETGEISLFDETVAYADKGETTVYEHLKKALDFSAEYVGQNGICQGLRADWNDCLNLGGGESSMVSFQHYWALQSFIEAAEHLDKKDDVEKYSTMADKVKEACEKELWDGSWYLRGFTGKGIKVGTEDSKEGKLFLNAQTWAVISGIASKERGISSMDAVDKHLYSDYGLHLLWPAYSEPDDDIGYVTRVYKGVKENAAIFSHPNPWAVIAECVLGRGERALKFYDAILPYNQNDKIEVRQAEPYSYCQFVMGKDHTAYGRARHPWLTGTAGWFYTAATKYILGIRTGYNGMIIDPCVSADWKEFEIERSWRGADFHITIKNPEGVSKGVTAIIVNGEKIAGPIPVQKEGSSNIVEVIMGS